jgi:hypothetical protein
MRVKKKTTADDVRRVALAALATALEDRKEEAKRKPGLTGMRAVATGAVIYTAGRAAFTGRRFVREHLGSDSDSQDRDEEQTEDEEYDDEPEAAADEDEEYDEPRAEEDEDEEYEEPRAEEDDEAEYEDDDEPQAEEDEDEPEAEAEDDSEEEDDDYEEPEAEQEERKPTPRLQRPPSRRPPSRAKKAPRDGAGIELPSRPSRSRAPVVRT